MGLRLLTYLKLRSPPIVDKIKVSIGGGEERSPDATVRAAVHSFLYRISGCKSIIFTIFDLGAHLTRRLGRADYDICVRELGRVTAYVQDDYSGRNRTKPGYSFSVSQLTFGPALPGNVFAACSNGIMAVLRRTWWLWFIGQCDSEAFRS
jgi:hypothetical protein